MTTLTVPASTLGTAITPHRHPRETEHERTCAAADRLVPPLRGRPAQIREARRFLATILDGCPAADDALLCLSELATNALLHSRSREPGGCFTVHAQRQGNHLRVEVHDQGGPWTPPALTNPGEQNGRGLAIVSELAHAWGRSGDEAGWTVWFEIVQDPAQRWVTHLTATGCGGYAITTG